jgi:hypothetical protein
MSQGNIDYLKSHNPQVPAEKFHELKNWQKPYNGSSLVRRASLKEKYGIEMSRFTLGNSYRKLNIGYLKIHSSFYSARSEE